MSTYSYPHTIENDAGEQLTFLRLIPGPVGDRLEVENLVKPGAGPPMHIHHYQEEALTVQQGRIGYPRHHRLEDLSGRARRAQGEHPHRLRVLFEGAGRVYIDDITLKEVDDRVPVTDLRTYYAALSALAGRGDANE